MAFYLLKYPDELEDWYKKHSKEMGETIATIMRRALREYKSRHTRQ